MRDQRLADLKAKEQTLFQKKQEALKTLKVAEDKASEIYRSLSDVRKTLQAKREAMNAAFSEAKWRSNDSKQMWDSYHRVKDANSPQIDAMKSEADAEHYAMVDCFERASAAYQYGNKAEAPSLASEGREHQARRNTLNDEARNLVREIKEARAIAEEYSQRVDWSLFKALKAEFEQQKAEKERLERDFTDAKRERDRLRAEFISLSRQYGAAKAVAKARLEEVRNSEQAERERVLAKAGVSHFERENAKIVKKDDGTTQVYHGGIGSGDGLGHGHTVIGQSGTVTYERRAFEKHGSQNFKDVSSSSSKSSGGLTGQSSPSPKRSRTERLAEVKAKFERRKQSLRIPAEDPALVTHEMRGNWDDLVHAWVDGTFPATISQGKGPNAGQTLIRDGFVNREEFDSTRTAKNHDHYGPDVKYSGGTERIEDKKGYRGYYTGPGH